MKRKDLDLEKSPVEISEGIYWVGYTDDNAGLHCNPYLIIENDEGSAYRRRKQGRLQHGDAEDTQDRS